MNLANQYDKCTFDIDSALVDGTGEIDALNSFLDWDNDANTKCNDPMDMHNLPQQIPFTGPVPIVSNPNSYFQFDCPDISASPPPAASISYNVATISASNSISSSSVNASDSNKTVPLPNSLFQSFPPLQLPLQQQFFSKDVNQQQQQFSSNDKKDVAKSNTSFCQAPITAGLGPSNGLFHSGAAGAMLGINGFGFPPPNMFSQTQQQPQQTQQSQRVPRMATASTYPTIPNLSAAEFRSFNQFLSQQQVQASQRQQLQQQLLNRQQTQVSQNAASGGKNVSFMMNFGSQDKSIPSNLNNPTNTINRLNTPLTAPIASLQVQKKKKTPPAKKQGRKRSLSGNKKARKTRNSKPAPNQTSSLSTEARKHIVSCESEVENDHILNNVSTITTQPSGTATDNTITTLSDDDDMSVVSERYLTPEEKTKANRNRNREHARNTRLRKKAYLEKLKCTVDELCRERDTLVSERANVSGYVLEMHNARTEVLMSFFALRNSYEKRSEYWNSVLEDSRFTCVMPVTPYRSFPASEVQLNKCQRTIMGIDGMIGDTASLHILLNSLVNRHLYPDGRIKFVYKLITEDAVVAGTQFMARWEMVTVNAIQLGAQSEVRKEGMLCCKFNSFHKIVSLEIMFDVMAFMLQLKQASGKDNFCVIPNTVRTCQFFFDSTLYNSTMINESNANHQGNEPMVMTLAERPYTIVHVNAAWEKLTGYKAEEVVGKESCQILQGPKTIDTQEEKDFSESIQFKRAAYGKLVHYTKDGRIFHNFMSAFPLSADSNVTHYFGLTHCVKFLT